jgi:hypothetical protein
MILAAALEDKTERSPKQDPLKPIQAIVRTTTVNLTSEKFSMPFLRPVCHSSPTV